MYLNEHDKFRSQTNFAAYIRWKLKPPRKIRHEIFIQIRAPFTARRKMYISLFNLCSDNERKLENHDKSVTASEEVYLQKKDAKKKKNFCRLREIYSSTIKKCFSFSFRQMWTIKNFVVFFCEKKMGNGRRREFIMAW